MCPKVPICTANHPPDLVPLLLLCHGASVDISPSVERTDTDQSTPCHLRKDTPHPLLCKRLCRPPLCFELSALLPLKERACNDMRNVIVKKRSGNWWGYFWSALVGLACLEPSTSECEQARGRFTSTVARHSTFVNGYPAARCRF